MAVENNWFTTNLSQRSATNLVDFQINIQPYEFVDKGFYENCNIQAKNLYERFNNLYISYSGGTDSEFVLKVFTDLGIKITPIIVMTPYTKRESAYAFKYCDSRNIPYEIVDLGDDCIQKMKEKTLDRGLFSLLAGVPLIVCDYVNTVGGKLMTGYGEPFTTLPDIQPTHNISEELEFCEWDYYLDAYDDSHPSGFFTYSLPVMYSLINEISYSLPTQQAKYELYQVEPRVKMFPDKEFYSIFRSMRIDGIKKYDYFTTKKTLFSELNKYRKT